MQLPEVIGINSFLKALPGPASEMKLHVIKGRPCTLQEAVTYATEVDAVIEAESRKTSRRRGDARMVEPADEDLKQEVKWLKEDLVQIRKELKEAQRKGKTRKGGRRPIEEVTCYGCGEKGHYRHSCPHNQEASQGNEPRRLDRQ